MRPFKCIHCGFALKVTHAGSDDGARYRQRRRGGIQKYWPAELRRAKTLCYRLRLDCPTPNCAGSLEVRRRSRAAAVRTARNMLRYADKMWKG